MYFRGTGVPEDMVKGMMWFEIAAAQKYGPAEPGQGDVCDDHVSSADRRGKEVGARVEADS